VNCIDSEPHGGTVAPVCVSVADACRALSIGRTTIYQLVKDGELRLFKLGARSLIPAQDLHALVSRRLAAKAAA